MMASPDIPVGRGFTVSFRLSDRGIEAEWLPNVPKGQKARQLLPAYRAARDGWIADLASEGVNVMLVEI